MNPADLTPAHTDAEIVATLAAFRADHWSPALIDTRQNRRGETEVWSRAQVAWVSVEEFAAEWRHAYRYRQVMGSHEEVIAQNRYERAMGL